MVYWHFDLLAQIICPNIENLKGCWLSLWSAYRWLSAILSKRPASSFGQNWVLKFGGGCEVMELLQNVNLMTHILKQIVRLKKHICGEYCILNIKGKQQPNFSGFWRIDNIALNQRYLLPCFALPSHEINHWVSLGHSFQSRSHRERTGSDISDSFYATSSQRRETVTSPDTNGQTHFVDALTQTSCQVKRSTHGGAGHPQDTGGKTIGGMHNEVVSWFLRSGKNSRNLCIQ